MSEYTHVEKPFLTQLAALGWRVIDQGPAYPVDPTISLRTSFREVVLRDLFHEKVRAINLIQLNHTDAFWNDVDKLLPDYRKRREWLRQHGAGMDL